MTWWQRQFHTVIPADLRDWVWRSYNAVGKSPFQTAVYLQDLTCQHLKISQDISRYLKISQDISRYLKISQDISRYLKISLTPKPHLIISHQPILNDVSHDSTPIFLVFLLPIISSTVQSQFLCFPRRVAHIPPPHWDQKRRRDARSHHHPQGTQRWVVPTERSDQTAPGNVEIGTREAA